MGKNETINFSPSWEKRKRKIPGYVGIIIALCIAAFAFSAFIILALNNFDLGKALGARDETTTVSSTEETTVLTDNTQNENAQFDNAINFLILCGKDANLSFCEIISVEPSKNKIRIKPLPVDYRLNFDGKKKTLSEAYSGESSLKISEAFSEKGINISKYVHLTEENFKFLMGKLGSVPIEIDGNYEFNIDAIKYTFSPGTQEMTSDMILKFMTYAAQGEQKLRLEGDVIASIFKKHFSQENFRKGESFFSSLINLVDTNITAFDYSTAQPILNEMLSGNTQIAVVS